MLSAGEGRNPISDGSVFHILSYLPPACLLTITTLNSELYSFASHDSLWLPTKDACVHCGKQFIMLDNREEKCISAINKRGKRHKGRRQATRAENRNTETLVLNRHMVERIRTGTYKPTVDGWENCALCAKRHLAWFVPDAQWETLPVTLRSEVSAPM